MTKAKSTKKKKRTTRPESLAGAQLLQLAEKLDKIASILEIQGAALHELRPKPAIDNPVALHPNASMQNMTKREYLAGLQMMGFISKGETGDLEYTAERALKAADYLMVKLGI